VRQEAQYRNRNRLLLHNSCKLDGNKLSGWGDSEAEGTRVPDYERTVMSASSRKRRFLRYNCFFKFEMIVPLACTS
jgi:hypothetical protein